MNFYLDIETIPGPNGAIISPQRQLRVPGTATEILSTREMEKNRKEAESYDEYTTRLSTSGTTCQIICIGYAIDNEAPVSLVGEELEILESFWPILRGKTLIVGHNVLDFDLKIIVQRSIVNKVKQLVQIPFTRFRSSPIFDTMHEWMKWHGKVSLNELALAFGIPSPKEDMNGAEVYPAWKRGEIERIATYCKRDVVTTREVFKRMTER